MEKNEMNKKSNVDVLTDVTYMVSNSIEIFTYENISLFPPELLLHNYKCGGYLPCCATVNTHTIVN
jgi:hypothetical protein